MGASGMTETMVTLTPIPASPVIFTAAWGKDGFQHNGDRVGQREGGERGRN